MGIGAIARTHVARNTGIGIVRHILLNWLNAYLSGARSMWITTRSSTATAVPVCEPTPSTPQLATQFKNLPEAQLSGQTLKSLDILGSDDRS
jgi:hypothetical protein